ncbi:hypothetical protein FAUST_7129 [Fusarium austroamericanum]|uniref:Uncharacterized protein n=1 Tax=Fusarium austroamericanum TaxID=282268 RepID=A0AAN6BYH8_FUSAU|nr:hypothetical protein FAUST_7129 [Fusarium austroamericanum]
MDDFPRLLSLPFELRDMIWTYCATTAESNGLLKCCHQARDEFTHHCILTEDAERLQTLRIWLDNLPGPTGGHMDMLRLHRFKTMDKCGAGIFARQNQNYPKSGGPYGASTEINRRLATLFDPFAAAHIIEMRDSCPHFRAVKWATASLSKHTKQMSDEAWLKFYPQGIRYY